MNWLRSALKLGIFILQFGLTAAIGGCAPMQFAKDGAGEEQLKQDSYVCEQQWQRSPKAINLNRDPFMNVYYKFTAGARLQECLEKKGWRPTDGEVQAKKPDVDTGQNQPRGQTAAAAPATPSTKGTLQPGVDATAALSNRGKFGVVPAEVTPTMSNLLKMDEVGGVFVAAVYAGSVASRAGIKKGDVILRYGDKVLSTDAEQLHTAIAATPPGSTVAITIWRNRSKSIVSAQY